MGKLTVSALQLFHLGPLDLIVEGGECVALVGDSGAGKTLLLRAIADLEVHSGELRLDGRRCEDFPAPQWRRQVGYLPAVSHWWHERVGEHFREPPTLELAALGFGDEVLDRPVSRLSTGEQQRLALLRLLINEPQALLLDEPTAALDEDNVRRVEQMLRIYCSRNQAALIWVSHDRAQLTRLAARRIHLREGRLQEDAA